MVDLKDIILTGAGFILGLAGTYLYWSHMLMLRPKVSLSPHIAVGGSRIDGKKVYRVKIINYGKRHAINLTLSLALKRRSVVGGEERSVTLSRVSIEGMENFFLGPKCNAGKIFGDSPLKYFSFHTIDLDSKLDCDTRLVASLISTDAISGSTVVKVVAYGPENLVSGDFRSDLTHQVFEQPSA